MTTKYRTQGRYRLNSMLFFLLGFLFIVQLFSCKKYLDEKPLQTQVVPSNLKDLQALLDNASVMNNNSPGLIEVNTDDYYVPGDFWNIILSFGGVYTDECLNYIWNKDATENNSWQNAYSFPVYYSNIVLDILPKINVDEANRNSWDAIKGSALFYRAFAFHQIAQLYCRPYSSSASTDPGIVLRLNSNINEPSVRATVEGTYNQIINDLKAAAALLPATVPVPTRPNKAAAYGALARTYLAMSDYVNAGHYAHLCLQQNNTLLDYNTLDPSGNPPFAIFHPEVMFQNQPNLNFIGLGAGVIKIDSTLYNSYSDNDLRKTMFFVDNGDGSFSFKGSYTGVSGYVPFDGFATDEMYLIRAECAARAGNKDEALTDLNALLISRWKNNGSWTPITATDANDAKNKILIERRKELIFRGVRWSDLRRLNLEGVNIAPKRVIDGITYTLPPNDLRWVMLIPPNAVNRSSIQQNPR